MGTDICPNCGAIIQDTDTVCMDCGVNIAEAKRKVAEKSLAERGGVAVSSQPSAVQGAAAGMAEAGETSEKVRLKAFDKHLAEKLARERAAVLLTFFLALVIGLVILAVGLGMLRNAGGVTALKALDFNDLRSKGLGMYGDLTFTAILVLLTGLAGLLCAVGQMRRYMLAGRAIAQVKRNERPDVVKISSWTWIGMVLASLAVPPLG
ncbi:MAG: zinc ribbon domain-containing protein, partial [Armatimonadetes bacterium]|nr:zinc ribbon domain-containing protein [Armatimonadota bacterium]